MVCRELDYFFFIVDEKNIGTDNERVGSTLDKCRERRINVRAAARFEDNGVPPKCMRGGKHFVSQLLGKRRSWISEICDRSCLRSHLAQ